MQIPKLRFKNFNDEWKEKKLNNFLTESQIKGTNGKTAKKLSVKLWAKGVVEKKEILEGSMETQYYTRHSGQLIYGKLDFLNCAFGIIPKELDGYQSTADVPVFDIKNINSKFLLNKIIQKNFYQKYGDIADGTRKAKRIHTDTFLNMSIYLPSIEEQTKIANFLSLIDRKIELQEKLVENLKLYKKGLLQKIFKNECQNVSLSNLLIEKNNKNSIGLEVCSVAVEKGVVNQVEHLGRSFSAKDTSKYNRVSYGNLVYTKSPTGLFPYGIIKQSYKKNDVAVSPLYAIYNPITFNVGVLIHSFFEYPINTNNYLHSLIQKGAKNTINISNSRFLEKSIPMPNDNSLIDKYANLIIDINDKISYETKKLQDLKTYKKGLLQQMFI